MSRVRIAQRKTSRNAVSLIDLRDEVAEAKDLVAASYMACHALGPGSSERSALCAVTNASRDVLEAAIERLDQVIAAAK